MIQKKNKGTEVEQTTESVNTTEPTEQPTAPKEQFQLRYYKLPDIMAKMLDTNDMYYISIVEFYLHIQNKGCNYTDKVYHNEKYDVDLRPMETIVFTDVLDTIPYCVSKLKKCKTDNARRVMRERMTNDYLEILTDKLALIDSIRVVKHPFQKFKVVHLVSMDDWVKYDIEDFSADEYKQRIISLVRCNSEIKLALMKYLPEKFNLKSFKDDNRNIKLQTATIKIIKAYKKLKGNKK